jgi:hypothetical protein
MEYLDERAQPKAALLGDVPVTNPVQNSHAGKD